MKTKTTLLGAALLLFSQFASADPINENCSDCPLAVPPSGTAGTTVSTLEVTTAGTIDSLDVFLDLSHTFTGDLDIFLTGGGLTDVLIVDSQGGSSNDFLGTVNTGLVGSAGTFFGTGNISSFVGAELAGTWILTVVDNFGGDLGILNEWGLRGEYTPVPEPGTLALLGIGLLGMGAARRRKKA